MRLVSSSRVRALALVLATAAAACGPSAGAKRAQAFLDRGDYPGAAQAADDELNHSPSDAVLHRIRLRAALGMGDARGAVDHYRAWRAGRGDDLAALHTMAMTTLWQGLRAPAAALRLQTIRAIERLELEDLAHEVGERLGDDDDAVAAAAAVAVLRAFPQAPDVASQMLHSDNPEARAIAVEGIGRKAGKLAAADLRAALDDGDPRVRAAAATAVGRLADPADTAKLAALVGDGDTGVRTAAVRALAHGKRGPLDAVVERALADESLGLRLAGVELASAGRGASGARALLDHRDPMVAAQAARAAHDPAGAARALDRALAADDPAVRIGAIGLVQAALGRDQAVPRLRTATADADAGVRVAAASALAYAGQTAPAI
ncbi:MAG TPA: HEAT repeat domain-containing protein, partial [Kofleriaceae bacterium]|nr:HEAT repeat domain-containing protein [Kofleriaceae bacterium]